MAVLRYGRGPRYAYTHHVQRFDASTGRWVKVARRAVPYPSREAADAAAADLTTTLGVPHRAVTHRALRPNRPEVTR
jgi:hypothetical protein